MKTMDINQENIYNNAAAVQMKACAACLIVSDCHTALKIYIKYLKLRVWKWK